MSRGGQNRLDLTGYRFGRLVALSYAGYKKKTAWWFCKCDCGKEKEVRTEVIRSGNTRSCGCLRNEVAAARVYKHGLSTVGNRHYDVWVAMRDRCYCPTSGDYYDYGRRGIKICNEWDDPVKFIRWCESYEPIPKGYSVDRIDVNGDYSPSNCRFASPVTQSRNRRPPSEWRWGKWKCEQEQ